MLQKEYFESYRFSSFEEVVTAIMPFGKFSRLARDFIFRGQKNNIYGLTPSVLREDMKESLWSINRIGKPIDNQSEWATYQIQLEYDLLKHFFERADTSGLYVPELKRFRNRMHDLFNMEIFTSSEEWLPDDLLELAGIAQHYGLQTRLLDWTYDYHVALYFSAIGLLDEANSDEDSIVWALNYRHFDFLWNTVDRTPLSIVRPSYYGNEYLAAQKGLFTMWKEKKESILEKAQKGNLTFNVIDRRPLDERIAEHIESTGADNASIQIDKLLYYFEIPSSLKKELLRWLYSNGYSEESLFPGYHGVVKAIRNAKAVQL
jgi:hypothetical protein